MISKKLISTVLITFCTLLLLWIVDQCTEHALMSIWDEALYANNALYMKQNHEWLTYYNYGAVDHHNSKPPLAIWLEVLSFNVFGVSELSARLPTYLSLVGLCGVVSIWFKKMAQSWIPGLLCCVLILTSPFLIQRHVFLTAELDGISVALQTTLILYSLYLAFSPSGTYSFKEYSLFFSLFFLCWLTKSTSVLIWLPSLTAIFLFQKRLVTFIKSKYFWICFFLVIAIIGAYYWYRESITPGVWDIVWTTEFKRVAVNPQPWLSAERDFYIELFKAHEMLSLWILLFSTSIVLIIGKLRNSKDLCILTFALLLFAAIISISPSKMSYYAAPFYPSFYILLVLSLWKLYGIIENSKFRFNSLFYLSGSLLVILLLGCRTLAFNAYLPKEINAHQDLENEIYAYQKNRGSLQNADSIILFRQTDAKFKHHDDALEFYVLMHRINHEQPFAISDKLRLGDHAIVSNPKYFDLLKTEYTFRTLDSSDLGVVLIVTGINNQNANKNSDR